MRRVLLLVGPALVLAACAEPPKVNKPRDQMSEREKDSVIASSSLPGAGVVKKGMAVADAEAKRAAMMDSAAGEN